MADQGSTATTKARPFPCPECGASEWTAHYMTPESQGVELFIGADGAPETGDYDGATRSYDPEPDDFYECGGCGHTVNPDGTPHQDAPAPELPVVCDTCGDLRASCTGDEA